MCGGVLLKFMCGNFGCVRSIFYYLGRRCVMLLAMREAGWCFYWASLIELAVLQFCYIYLD